MQTSPRPFAIITGASSGIGYELAKCCAEDGFDLLLAADQPAIHQAAKDMQALGVHAECLEADLATSEGIDHLYAMTRGRPVDALLANAGHGLGKSFLDQTAPAWCHVIDTNITGTLYLIQKVAQDMRLRGQGRILITGSVAGFMPGTYQAVYNGTKAFLDSFSFALRHELKATGITVTCLMPGATETDFFARADMLNTRMGSGKKDDAAEVARQGFQAMMNDEGEVITGWQNKMRAAIASVVPADLTAKMHKKLAEPLTAKTVRAH